MPFGRWSKKAELDPEAHALSDAVRLHMPGVDDDTHRIVTAVAGLLGGVAYADREYAEREEGRVRAELGRIGALSHEGAEAIILALREHIVEIATVQAPRYARALRELADRDLRLQVLEMLLELAAADDVISHQEVQLLRNTANALGLDQADYNAVQAKHRDKISLLK